jgi:hypothetical protein
MAEKKTLTTADAVKAHAAADEAEIARLRGLTMRERSELIESACEAAAEIYRSRLAAGLPDIQPDPWPESTRGVLEKARRPCPRLTCR